MASGIGEHYINVDDASGTPWGYDVDYSGLSGFDPNETYFNESTASPHPHRNPRVIIPLATVMSILSLMTTIGNALVIVAVRTDRRLRTVSNYFILSLAVADLLIGLLVMPLSIIYFVEGEWWLGLIVCQVWLTMDYVTCTASIFSLNILSLDRYWSISSPLKYMRKRTPCRATFMISIAWCLSSLWIIPVWGWHYFGHNDRRLVPRDQCDTEFHANIVFKVVSAILNFYIPLVSMLFVYGKIFYEIKTRSKMTVGQKSNSRKGSSMRTSPITSPLQIPLNNSRSPPLQDEHKEEEQNASWVPDFDSLSTSKDTSQECADQSDSFPPNIFSKRIRKGEVDHQLKNISHLTLATFGLAGIVGPSAIENAQANHRIIMRQKAEGDKLEVKQVQRVLPQASGKEKADPIIPTIHEPSYSSSSGAADDDPAEAEGIPMIEINGHVRSEEADCIKEVDDSLLCSDRNANLNPKRRISFNIDAVTSREELEPLRRNSCDDRKTSRHKYRGVRYDKESSSPTHLLPNNNDNHVGENNSLRGSIPNTELKDNKLQAKFSFARFSIRHGKTSEFLRDRIKRFSLNKERKAAKQLGIIVGCFITCWLPYFISFMVIAYCPTCVNHDVHYALIWLGYMNSTMNPFIYPLCNSNFRKAFKNIFAIITRTSPKPGSQGKTMYRRSKHK